MRITVTNHGPDEARVDVLPTLWFRNNWAFEEPGSPPSQPPTIRAAGGVLRTEHRLDGAMTLAGDGDHELLFCDNETNNERLYGVAGRSPFPKDGINDHIVAGAPTVNPRTGRQQGGSALFAGRARRWVIGRSGCV